MTTLNATIDPFVGTVTTTNMASCTCPQWPRISRKRLHENTKYGVKTFKVEQIALQYWYNTIAFSGLSGSMEEDFSTESQLRKKLARPEIKTPYMRKGRHSPFKLESSDKDHHNHHHLIIIDMVLALASLQRNSLYRATRIANVEGILDFSVPSTILVKAGLMQITLYVTCWLRMTLPLNC